jgi:hypothetical protein
VTVPGEDWADRVAAYETPEDAWLERQRTEVLERVTITAAGGLIGPIGDLSPYGRATLDGMPRFEFQRGPIQYAPVPTGPPPTPERQALLHQRMLRMAAWGNRVEQFCVCRWITVSNGDHYEDQHHRVDGTACPVHGRADTWEDDDE